MSSVLCVSEDLHVLPERVDLVSEAHHPGVRHRAADGNAEAPAGLEIRRRRAAGDEGGACRQHRRLDPVRASAAELDDRAAVGRRDHAGRLAGDRCLERHEREQRRLDQLRLAGRRGHTQDRLVVEDDLAFLHGPQVAGEAKRGEVLLEEGGRHIRQVRQASQPRDLVVSEAQRGEIFDRLLEAGGHQVLAGLRQLADEQLERTERGLAGRVVPGHHRDLIEVGGERAGHVPR